MTETKMLRACRGSEGGIGDHKGAALISLSEEKETEKQRKYCTCRCCFQHDRYNLQSADDKQTL